MIGIKSTTTAATGIKKIKLKKRGKGRVENMTAEDYTHRAACDRGVGRRSAHWEWAGWGAAHSPRSAGTPRNAAEKCGSLKKKNTIKFFPGESRLTAGATNSLQSVTILIFRLLSSVEKSCLPIRYNAS
jgi:hypothetical protein